MWGSGTTDCVWIAPEHLASDDRYVVRVTDVDALHTILTCSSSSFVVSLKLGWHALFGWIKVSPESGPDVRCNAGRYRRVVWPTVDLCAMQTMSYETGETDENKRIQKERERARARKRELCVCARAVQQILHAHGARAIGKE